MFYKLLGEQGKKTCMALGKKVTYCMWSLSVVIRLLMNSYEKGKEDWNLLVSEYQK